MSLLFWIVVGGIIGWLASRIMGTDARQGLILNIVVGVVGAAIGGALVDGGSVGDGLSVRSFLVSLFGAVLLLGLVNLVRRGTIR